MTPEAQRIAIAEACGATCGYRPTTIGPKLWIHAPASPFWDKYRVTRPEEEFGSHYLPDYLNDLNAMHEAEKVLTDAQESEFRGNLVEVCGSLADALHATASQRAEAFLRTLGLWREEA